MKFSKTYRNIYLLSLFISISGISLSAISSDSTLSATQPNIIFVLTDDQRYDELGFMNPVIETPNMDKMAREGTHFKNAFVTTALCSPSRASILTGQYMHNHGVVDNNKPPKKGTIFFPSYLQQAGYNTAFIGKWHMGEAAGKGAKDAPQPGFDHWISFPGQGIYYPRVNANGEPYTLNINGKRVPQKGYITDELTNYSIDWLKHQSKDKPFFLYLSHKAVHADFAPAKRHEQQYAGKKIPIPASQANTDENYEGKPLWVKNQRNSWHGVDFPYHSILDVQSYKMEYHRALSAVDDSLGSIFNWLEENGQDQNTIVILMGDNGFMFGEHGLIDKRNAYEESMRVPLLVRGPNIVAEDATVEKIAANIDIAPTILEMAGIKHQPQQFEGLSWLSLAKNNTSEHWRDELLYEYYWEFNYPQTPTTFALRTDQYKFITYHGVWDTEELYDIKNDPNEMYNLINNEAYLKVISSLRARLYSKLENDLGQTTVPYTERFSTGAVLREATRSKEAKFPKEWLKVPDKNGDIQDARTFMQPDAVRAKQSKVNQIKL
ncbi:sulfatase family protein [Paraglaciecola arctica]|uniref:sulfatase family protein n=1 Tax=Paraglaciecola arctica TaxID=1128911 RepID=UPI001C07AF2B|nr:sulfatase [Paraglaciecola arctica]MBU3005367.1 sulfatase [Paraglaciecola arctica]